MEIPSKLSDPLEKAHKTKQRVEGRARPGDLTEKEAEVRVTPKSLTRLRRYKRVSTQYI